MNSLQDLNAWGNTAIQFADDRPTVVTFTETSEPMTILIDQDDLNSPDDFVKTLPVQYTIVPPVVSIPNDCTYVIDTETPDISITWPDIPPGFTVDTVPGDANTYRITGAFTPDFWDRIKNPLVTFSTGYNSDTLMQISVTAGNQVETSTCQVFDPLLNANEWFYSTNPNWQLNDHDNIGTYIDIRQTSDTLDSNSIVVTATGPSAATASLQFDRTEVQGVNSVYVFGNGQVLDPINTTEGPVPRRIAYGSITTDLSFSYASGAQFTAENIELKINVDCLSDVEFLGSPGETQNLIGYRYNIYHVSSGRDNRFETNITLDWENFDPQYFQRAWIVNSNTFDLTSFNNATIVPEFSGTGFERILVAQTEPSEPNGIEIFNRRIDKAVTNHPSVVNPSLAISQPFTIVIEKGVGNPDPTGTVTWSITKANVTGPRSQVEFIRGWS